VVDVHAGEAIPSSCQIYVMGGGEDAPQALAARELRSGSALLDEVERGAAVLAVCAGLQVLGRRFTGEDGKAHEGLGLLDCETHRDDRPRRVGEVVVTPEPFLALPDLTGYENHGGVTTLGPSARPLGQVVVGNGNAGGDGSEGIVNGRVVGTYLHGPVLARNPALADHLLASVLGPLAPLEDLEVDVPRRSGRQPVRGGAEPDRRPTAGMRARGEREQAGDRKCGCSRDGRHTRATPHGASRFPAARGRPLPTR